MHHIQVACAIIEREDKVMVAQRSETMSLPLKWEFPGGKLKADETSIECLHRELLEELGVRVDILQALPPTTHHYPGVIVTLHPFICALARGEPSNKEHSALLWLPLEALAALDWAEADLPIIADYCRLKNGELS